MKKVLSLAFIAAVLLLGCSADGFFTSVNDGNPQNGVKWGKRCKLASGACVDVQSAKDCTGSLVSQSDCP